jgi:hypothetical protein
MAEHKVTATDAETEAALERAKLHDSQPRAVTVEHIPSLNLLIVGLSNQRRLVLPTEIAENVKHLIEQLEQGKSEALTAYLNAMARFHNYSFGNILSIAHHRPDATHVAGIRTWNEFGRYVKKGQKGIPILAPMIGARRQRDEEPAEQSGKPAPVLIGLRDDGGQPQKNCDRRARQCPTLLRVLKESPYKSPYSLVRVGGREEGGHCS